MQKTLEAVFKSYLEAKPIFKNKDILTEHYLPGNIVHREEQINQIAKIIAPAIRDEKISNVLIYGKVGTGKSLTVKHVTKELAMAADIIKILYINCKMKKVADTEYRLVAEILRTLGHIIPTTGLPTDRVYKIFFEKVDEKKQSIILVLDEIDAIIKKTGDEILYNLTRINQELKQARMSIIGISNDASFIENIDPRVKSSLSEEEIVFPPYNASQLRDILLQRAVLTFNDNVLGEGVISKCAALAAQEHGDARKALDLLRIAAEITEREGQKNITTEHVDKAEEKLDVDRLVEVVRRQPKQSLAVLASVIKLSEKKQKSIQTGDIFAVYEESCRSGGFKMLTQRRVSDLIAELDMLGVINSRVISKGRYGRTREIRIKLSQQALDKIKSILHQHYLL